jgi:hypothetical protein
MAIKEHLQKLNEGPEVWNKWVEKYREENRNFLDECTEDSEPIHFIDLSWAYLGGMNLSGVDLTGADLYMTNLGHANLSKAILSEANLRLTNLSEADLSHALLHGAILSEVNLWGANFDHLKLSETIFANVDIRGVRGLEAVEHQGPSEISIGTIISSEGQIPELFLRGCGLPEAFIVQIPALVAALQPIQFYSCFISYSNRDEELAQRLYADLQSKGVRCWFAPEDMKIGDRFRRRIDEVIRAHDKLLLILSEHSVASSWVEKEVETAMESEDEQKRTILFPVRLDDSVMKIRTGWPADVRRTRHIGDFRLWKEHDEYRKVFERLLADLKAVA